MNKREIVQVNRREILVLVILFVIACFCIFGFIKIKKNPKLIVTENGNSVYSVNLKQNQYFKNTTVSSNMLYIAQLIDNINITLNYDQKTNQKTNNNYSYYIESIVTVHEKGHPSNILYKDTTNLLPENKYELQGNSEINISEKVNVKYDEYNDLIASLKAEHKLNVDSNIKIVMHITSKLDYEKFNDTKVNTQKVEITIPLTEITLNITAPAIDETKVLGEEQGRQIINYVLLVVGIVMFVFVLMNIYYTHLKNQKLKRRTAYERFVSKLLNQYDRLIYKATENTTIREEDYEEIIETDDFLNLVKLVNAKDHIIYTSGRVNKSEGTWHETYFTVKNGTRLYKYTVDSRSFLTPISTGKTLYDLVTFEVIRENNKTKKEGKEIKNEENN